MGAPAVTESTYLPRVPGAGSDIVHLPAPEETIRHWVRGDAYPRLVLDVQNFSVLVGDGTVPPVALSGGGGGGGAPTTASYVTMAAEAGLSAETILANVHRRDVIANRGSFGNAGVLFGATDTGIGYRDSGSAWDPFFAVLDGAGHIASTLITAITESQVTGLVSDLSTLTSAVAGKASATQALGGDMTGSSLPNPTVAASAITLAKLANIGAATMLGNNTGGNAAPIALTAAQTKTLLAITEADVANLLTDLGALQMATSLQAAQIAARATADLGYYAYSSAGLALTPSGTAGKLDMAAGTGFFGTTELNCAQQLAIATTITTLAAGLTVGQSLWVAVELDSTKVVNFNAGAGAIAPTFPTPSTTRVVLGWLWIPFGATTVDTTLGSGGTVAKLIDARIVRTGHPARIIASDTSLNTLNVTTSTALASLLGATKTIPADSLNVGDLLDFNLSFGYTNNTTATTVQIQILIAGVTFLNLTTALVATNALPRAFQIRTSALVTAIGGSGKLAKNGITSLGGTGVNTVSEQDMFPANTSTVDTTTAPLTVDVQVRVVTASNPMHFDLVSFTILKYPA